MKSTDPIAVLGGAVNGFREFAATIKAGVPRVCRGSLVESDQAKSGNVVVPHLIVSGLVSSVADHLSAWAELADSPQEDSQLLLHVTADYTLFRPVVEGLVEVIWILDGKDSDARIRRALDIAKIEFIHGAKLVKAMRKAKFEDEKTAQGIEALGRIIRSTAISIRLDAEEYLAERPVDPSAITRKVAHLIPGDTLRALRFWAITSAHAHGQLISTMRFAEETKLSGVHEGGAYFATDETLLAELIHFVEDLMKVAITQLNEQGYELVR